MTDANDTPQGSAFLLAQLGAHAARRFGERLGTLDLTQQHAGVLRLVDREPGINQRTLAERLGASPSWVVTLLDELQQRGLLVRTRSESDRRIQELRLTSAGETQLDGISKIVLEHERELTAPLSAEERDQLRKLLVRLAEASDLAPGVHPGYRDR